MRVIRLRVKQRVVAVARLVREDGTDRVIVEQVYVKPAYRGHGYAKRLLKQVVAWADQRHVTLILDARPGEYQGQRVVKRDVRRLQRLYAAVGFRKTTRTMMQRNSDR